MSIEENVRRKVQRNNIKQIILLTLKTSGVLTIGLIAPNVLQAFSKLGLLELKPYRYNQRIKRAVDALLKEGSIEFRKNERGTKYLTLSEKGKSRLRSYQLHSFHVKKPKRWDEKWRMVIFDIPEKMKSAREELRIILSSIGFKLVQRSVWVYPYDCEETHLLIKADLGLGKYVIYLVVDEMENDRMFRDLFELT